MSNYDQAVNNIKAKQTPYSGNTKEVIVNEPGPLELTEPKISTGILTTENSIVLEINKGTFFKSIFVSIIIGFILGVMVSSLVAANTRVKLKEQELSRREEIYAFVDKQQTIINENEELVSVLGETNSELNNIILEIRDETIDLQDELDAFKERAELYNKYEYVLTTGPKKDRTDVTYEQIKFGEEKMIERGLDPHLLYSVVSVESRGTEKAKNSKSTATGYCQFLKGTARWVYEDLLKKGTYNHNKALDGYINLEMGAEYLSYLMKSNNGDVYKSLLSYNGGELGANYYHKVNAVLSKNTSTNLDKIQSRYRSKSL